MHGEDGLSTVDIAQNNGSNNVVGPLNLAVTASRVGCVFLPCFGLLYLLSWEVYGQAALLVWGGWSAPTWVEPRFKQFGVALKGRGGGSRTTTTQEPRFRTQVQPREEPRFEPRFNPGSNPGLTQSLTRFEPRFQPRFQPGFQSGFQAFLKLLKPSLNNL